MTCKLSVLHADVSEVVQASGMRSPVLWRIAFAEEMSDWYVLDRHIHLNDEDGTRWGLRRQASELVLQLHPYRLPGADASITPQKFGAQHGMAAMWHALEDLPAKPQELIVVQSSLFLRSPPEEDAIIFAGVAVHCPRS